jgi:DNA-binding transcriptional ArsR family regulator
VDAIQAIALPRRREILRLVWHEPLPVSAIAAQVDVTIGAVSQHLARLREAGLVTVSQQGRQRLYAADRDALAGFAPLLEAMWRADLDRLAANVEQDQEPHSSG